MAAHQKKAGDLNATLGFTDECGVLLAPLVRRSLARVGHTPVLRQRARHRDKVSLLAALTLSPVRGRLGLHYRTYPGRYVDGERYARFLRDLLGRVRGPLVLLHDGGAMHKGPPVEAVRQDFAGRLHVHRLPPYAPELNPPEYLWTYLKYHRLGNFVPEDTGQIDATVRVELELIRHDQHRLRSFFLSSPLSWDATGLF